MTTLNDFNYFVNITEMNLITISNKKVTVSTLNGFHYTVLGDQQTIFKL